MSLLSKKQLAEHLGVTPGAINHHLLAGNITEFVVIDGRKFFPDTTVLPQRGKPGPKVLVLRNPENKGRLSRKKANKRVEETLEIPLEAWAGLGVVPVPEAEPEQMELTDQVSSHPVPDLPVTIPLSVSTNRDHFVFSSKGL